jgi:uncharacterized repeat protein (TIGR02543 family)
MKKLRGLCVLCALISALSASAFYAGAEEVSDTAVTASDTEKQDLFSITYITDGGSGKIDYAEPCEAGETVKLSVWALRKDGYSHIGWTDGEHEYTRGQKIKMPEKNLTLMPLWKKIYTLSFEDLTQYGYSSSLPSGTVSPGEQVYLPNYAMFNGNSRFNGWLVNGVHHDPLSYFTMPEEDTYVCVDWLDPINFVYSAGDVDGVVGNAEYRFDKYPGSKLELSDSTRLARIGYSLTGWYHKEEDTVYKPEQTIVIPDKDTTMYAIWSPVKVGMYFYANGGHGKMGYQVFDYDTVVNIPECVFTNEGYKLHGWKLKEEYYAPGAHIHIKTQKMYEALDMNAVWIEEDRNPGDLNGDGYTDITDVSMMSLQLLGEEVVDEDKLSDADVLYDGDLNLQDLVYYKQFLMGKKVLLGMESGE